MTARLADICKQILKFESLLQACKLAPDIGHLSGKFEGFDWRILSLTGHFDWALPLGREIKKIYFHLRKTNVMSDQTGCMSGQTLSLA